MQLTFRPKDNDDSIVGKGYGSATLLCMLTINSIPVLFEKIKIDQEEKKVLDIFEFQARPLCQCKFHVKMFCHFGIFNHR